MTAYEVALFTQEYFFLPCLLHCAACINFWWWEACLKQPYAQHSLEVWQCLIWYAWEYHRRWSCSTGKLKALSQNRLLRRQVHPSNHRVLHSPICYSTFPVYKRLLASGQIHKRTACINTKGRALRWSLRGWLTRPEVRRRCRRHSLWCCRINLVRWSMVTNSPRRAVKIFAPLDERDPLLSDHIRNLLRANLSGRRIPYLDKW